MSEEPLDVRVRRTRERLQGAVLRLASEHPVEEIAVADLVRDARVNRTTFYKHAASPVEILEQILYADLDRLRAEWLSGSWDDHSGALADHVERYDGVYTKGLVGQRSAVLHRLLVEHFAASARALLDARPQLLPEGTGSPQWRTKAYSAFIAHGQVGIVEAWLGEPRPRDRRLLISASAAMLPSWLVATFTAAPPS
ncbi:TetR/AcrR family transcriptional regulator [Actinoplanes sp. NPDC023936]|uniref:TetR/AcrR family transcriptional regulator n=1 Tax=Actinoplanes sp. NPDC023936 TaxID=3154910 RepID=UPI0033CAEF8A